MAQEAPPDINALLGGASAPAAAPAAEIQGIKQQFLDTVRNIAGEAGALSEQFPAFAPFAETITKAAQEGMLQVIAQMSMAEQGPNPMGMV